MVSSRELFGDLIRVGLSDNLFIYWAAINSTADCVVCSQFFFV